MGISSQKILYCVAPGNRRSKFPERTLKRYTFVPQKRR